MLKRIMSNYIEKKLNDRIGKKEYQFFWENLYDKCLIGMNIGGGSGVKDSGEENALEYIREHIITGDEAVLFDIGANIGDYTRILMNHFSQAYIHCFEPASETFRTLFRNINNDKVLLNNVGLSNEVSSATLYYDKEASGMASLYERQLDWIDWTDVSLSKSERVELITIDKYCLENMIDSIDFMKMDVEGNEYKVLLGAEKMLKEKRIKAIQMEFGGCNVDSRTFFRDFWNLLNKDFSFFRIVSDGLQPISKYKETLEIFTCTNYLLINKQYEE